MEEIHHGTAQEVALEVLRHGPLRRADLARRLQVSPGSLSRLSRPLLGNGLLVEERSRQHPATGRPHRPLEIAADSHHFVGVNITGTDCWAVVTDLRATVVDRLRLPLPDITAAGVVGVVREAVHRLTASGPGPSAAGLTIGGHVDADGVVVRAPFLEWWSPVPLRAELEAVLGMPLVVGNDIAALTRVEHWFGVARGCTGFAVITIGAGVGYGLVVHDRIIETDIDGLQLIGHHPLDDSGPRCPQGHRGCAMALITDDALSAIATEALGRATTHAELLDAAGAGDPAARAVTDRAGRHLGRLISTAVTFTRVEKVLLTGEGVRLAQVAAAAVAEGIAEHRDPRAGGVDVVVRPHDHHEWARGAAGMAVQSFVTTPGTGWTHPQRGATVAGGPRAPAR